MGSSGKQRTTYAKLNRESKLRDKRAEKQARKVARKLDAAGETTDSGFLSDELGGLPADPETDMTDGTHLGPAGDDGGI